MKLLTFFAFLVQNSSEEHCRFGLIGMNLISITKHIMTILLMRYCASPVLFDIEMKLSYIIVAVYWSHGIKY
jgi:hypothetical protein